MAGVAAGLLAGAAFPSDAYNRPGVAQRVSLETDGHQLALGTGDRNSITPDGRFVAYVAEQRVVGTTTIGDVYVLDRRTGKVAVASVTSAGARGIAPPFCSGASTPAISDDGRYVAFFSCYANFPGAVGGIYLRDLKAGTTTLVSVSADGVTPAAGTSMQNPTISADGRYVAFESTALNIVATPCAPVPVAVPCLAGRQVYVRDMRGKGSTVLVSASSTGGWPDGESSRPSISADGRFVAFTSKADDLTINDHNLCTSDSVPSCPDVYLRDLKTNTTELISVALDGQAAQGRFVGSYTDWVQGISRDDRYIAFASSSANLVPNTPTGGGFYVRDRKTHRTVNVGVDSYGQPVHPPVSISVSPDGRYYAGDAVTIPCDPALPAPAFVTLYDVVTGAMQTLGRTDSNGQPVPCSEYYNVYTPEIATGGRLVTFATNGARVVAGDTNKTSDVFVQDRGPALGAGGLRLAGRPGFASSGVLNVADQVADVAAPLAADGANLIAGSLAYRPALADLFVRLSVEQMRQFALADPALVYGLDFSVGRTPYEVRVTKNGVAASFVLFRHTATGWVQAAQLRGGYGTTGPEVVFAVRLADISARPGAVLQHVRAFTGFGAYAGSPIERIDELTL